MNATLIQDTFKYFAKYPLKAGVMKNFGKESSTYFTGYDTLKTAVNALNPHSLIPNLDEYIFGSDLSIVSRRIEAISGIYLFVDFGNIYDTLLEPMKTEVGEFTIAVTIARKIPSSDLDSIEHILLSDITLGMITQLKDLAKADRSNIYLKNLTFPNDITPWFARDLWNSTGWTMTFKTRGAHLV
jgi:hypothetical protein